MSDKARKTPHLVTYSESEQDYSAELFDAETNLNDVHPTKDKTEDESTGASRNVSEPKYITKDNDKDESVDESGKVHIGQDMKDFGKKSEDSSDDKTESACENVESEENMEKEKSEDSSDDKTDSACENVESEENMEKEKSEMGSDVEDQSNAGLEHFKLSEDPKNYFSWKRYERNCVNRVYHSDTDKSDIFDAPKKRRKIYDDERIHYYKKNRKLIELKLRSSFENEIMMKWHLAKKAKEEGEAKKKDDISTEEEAKDESEDKSSFTSDTSDETSDHDDDEEDNAGANCSEGDEGHMEDEKHDDFDQSRNEDPSEGNPGGSGQEQKSNSIYQVDATAYDADDEGMAESDFTRFYNETESNAKQISLKIEDIGEDDEVDVTVENVTLCNNIVNYAESDNKNYSSADNDSQFDNGVQGNETQEVENSESLPKPFAYDVALKQKLSKKTLTYSEQLSEEGNASFFTYNYVYSTITISNVHIGI